MVAEIKDVTVDASSVSRVEPAPHLSDGVTTRRLMIDVIVALLPAVAMAVVYFGSDAIRLIGASVVACLVTEAAFNIVRGKPNSLGDCSAIVTALILALTLPPNLPTTFTVLGSVVAIAIGKMIYGGLGQNIFNPAMVGRAFLMAAFPVAMTTWIAPLDVRATATAPAAGQAVQAMTQATPLTILKPADHARTMPDLKQLFLGQKKSGSLGETSVLALLVGAAYLLMRRTIDISIPFGMLGTCVAFGGIAYWAKPDMFANPMFHLAAGGLVFGAFFIATDLVSSPLSLKGRWIYGIGCGVFTMVIRQFGTYPEGVMFSVLIMNAFAPLITRWTRSKPLGGRGRA